MNLLSPVFVYALWHANYPTQLPWRALDLRVREDNGNKVRRSLLRVLRALRP